MRKVTIGGDSKLTVAGWDAIEFNIRRMKEWMDKPDNHVLRDMFPETGEFRGREADLTSRIIKTWELNWPLVLCFKGLHQKIVVKFLREIDRWLRDHPGGVTFTDDPAPGDNYTEEMTRLKNVRFDGWDPSRIKGFCVREPVERMQQLLNFPITKFMSRDHFPVLSLPAAPEPPEQSTQTEIEITSLPQLIDWTEKNKSHLSAWRTYYLDMCEYWNYFYHQFWDA